MAAVFTATRQRIPYHECETVRRLLEKGSETDGILNSQFIAYAHLNDLDSLNLLLTETDINSINYYGYTALMEACHQENYETVRFLLSRGANPNIVNEKTSLICSIYRHNLEIVQLLIENGADLHLKTIYGDTAWSSAKASTPKMRSLLRKYLDS